MPLALYPPRRFLVSPDGVAHDPLCRRVPVTAESHGWGELSKVADALLLLHAGHSVESVRRGTLPGPEATTLCGTCMSAPR